MVKAIENLQKRRLTGGRRKAARQRMLSERDSYSTECVLGEYRSRRRRSRGGNVKIMLDATNKASVTDPGTNKMSHISIIGVTSNPSNRDYDRRGVITKGAIIETELGNAKVRSRPGQDGVVNATLIK